MTEGKCIWCLGPAIGRHVEHIIPEALGCPESFTLSDNVICVKCNNGLGHLDQAVIDEFDFLTFGAKIPRKKGKPPSIHNRGNVRGTHGTAGPEITFNMEGHSVLAHDGTRIASFKGNPRDIKASFERGGQIARIKFDVPFGQGPKFVRGITKIAFSSLAYFLGAQIAYAEKFNAVRAFVRFGKGHRHTLIMDGSATPYSHHVVAPFVSSAGDYTVQLRLAVVEFCLDLSEGEYQLPMLVKKATDIYPKDTWSVLPTRGAD